MDLKDLEKVDLILRQLAVDIVKYQNFKFKSALSHLSGDFKDTTKKNYFENGIAYIKRKKISKTLNKKIYGYIDEAIKNHIQPLTPSKDDKRVFYDRCYQKKDAILPVQNVIKQITKNKSLVEKFEYGVRFNDTVKVFKTKQEADMFLNGILFTNNTANIVTVTNLEGQ